MPLSDIRVADFSQVLAGPFAGQLLGDLGAEVIKVEPPEGDSARVQMPVPGANGSGVTFLTFNRNKRSLVLDITKPKGRGIAYSLVGWADVVIMNMRIGARQRHGFTYEDLAAINPRIIYVSITGYGENGPDADLGGADVVIQARAGDLDARRPPEGPPPASTAMVHFDMATALLSLSGVLLALREREHTGVGQKVEVNLLQTALALQARQITRIVGSDLAFPGNQPRASSNYQCSDGKYIYAPHGGERWDTYCRAVGLTSLVTDPRFDTNEKRTQQAQELSAILARQFFTRPAAEWETVLKAKGLGVTVVRSFSDVHDDPQVIANQMVLQYHHPGVGQVKVINFPFQMSGIPAGEIAVRRPPPTKGEHTDEVLRELGHAAQEIASLREEGVVA